MKLQKIGVLLMVIVMTLCAGLTVSAKDVSDYNDVHENDWHYSYVKDVSEQGLMTGLNATTFGPSQKLARSQFATIIYRMYGSPQTSYKAFFKDVTDGNFYSVPVTWASQFGVITGYTDGSGNFGPADDITREQLATMLYRYADKLGYDLSISETANNFPDGSSVSAFALDGMNWCISKGIITGDQGKINPQGTVNRAVCATMISRFNGESTHEHIWVEESIPAKTHTEDKGRWMYTSTIRYPVTYGGCSEDKVFPLDANINYNQTAGGYDYRRGNRDGWEEHVYWSCDNLGEHINSGESYEQLNGTIGNIFITQDADEFARHLEKHPNCEEYLCDVNDRRLMVYIAGSCCGCGEWFPTANQLTEHYYYYFISLDDFDNHPGNNGSARLYLDTYWEPNVVTIVDEPAKTVTRCSICGKIKQ